jgi:hypothetical protein
MKALFALGLVFVASLVIGTVFTGPAHATPSLRAAENWCRLHPDARESGDADEHLMAPSS